MKELKMFPQITEEPEESLVNLEEEPRSPYSSTPPLNPSCSSSESPPDAPSSPNHEVRPSSSKKENFVSKLSHIFNAMHQGWKCIADPWFFVFVYLFQITRFWTFLAYSFLFSCFILHIYLFFSFHTRCIKVLVIKSVYPLHTCSWVARTLRCIRFRWKIFT